MALYNDFYDSLLPGNYALTKSMELTKIKDSGTLWYTKKYLTLYYYVFLSNDIDTDEYVEKIRDIFEKYINSLPCLVYDVARKYFFSKNSLIDFSSRNFVTFRSFANKTSFSNKTEKNEYYNSAKKCYFALLMGTGGQSGVKKYVIEGISKESFHYNIEAMQQLILESAIKAATDRKNQSKNINTGDIPRILSQEAIHKITHLDCSKEVSVEQVKNIVKIFPCSDEYNGEYCGNKFTQPAYAAVENDCFASIRNERQILYYYGYFHSKTSGTTDFEFSSLTPIGDLAIKANFYEFLAIWEHQKVKMVSQPATVSINNINGMSVDFTKFDISTTPYTDILSSLIRQENINLDEYKYIISRRKDMFDAQIWSNEENTLFLNIKKIKNRVINFGRIRDKKDEDARKELLKYILGIRSDLKADSETNPLNIVCFSKSELTAKNENSLKLLYNIYSKLDDYKKIKYKSVYSEIKEDLRSRYENGLSGNDIPPNARSKIHWDLYNIRSDKLIMLGTVIAIASISLGYKYNDIENSNGGTIESLCKYVSEKFSSLLKNVGIRPTGAIKQEISKFITAIKKKDYSDYLRTDEEHESQVLATYREETVENLKKRIEQISKNTDVDQGNERERNINLVKLLKSYYMARYSDNNNILTCECCGEKTFITEAGEPYIEFHHLIPFNIAYGPDHYLNLFALCPNCHRRIHFLNIEKKFNEYKKLCKNNYLQITLVERLEKLKEQNLLKSYHLEYLLTDNAITQDEYNQIIA